MYAICITGLGIEFVTELMSIDWIIFQELKGFCDALIEFVIEVSDDPTRFLDPLWLKEVFSSVGKLFLSTVLGKGESDPLHSLAQSLASPNASLNSKLKTFSHITPFHFKASKTTTTNSNSNSNSSSRTTSSSNLDSNSSEISNEIDDFDLGFDSILSSSNLANIQESSSSGSVGISMGLAPTMGMMSSPSLDAVFNSRQRSRSITSSVISPSGSTTASPTTSSSSFNISPSSKLMGTIKSKNKFMKSIKSRDKEQSSDHSNLSSTNIGVVDLDLANEMIEILKLLSSNEKKELLSLMEERQSLFERKEIIIGSSSEVRRSIVKKL